MAIGVRHVERDGPAGAPQRRLERVIVRVGHILQRKNLLDAKKRPVSIDRQQPRLANRSIQVFTRGQ